MATSAVPPPQPPVAVAPVTPSSGPQTAASVKSTGKAERIQKDKHNKQKHKKHKDDEQKADGEHTLDIEV